MLLWNGKRKVVPISSFRHWAKSRGCRMIWDHCFYSVWFPGRGGHYHEHSSWQMRTRWRLWTVYTPKPQLNWPHGRGRSLRIVVGSQCWRPQEPITDISSNLMFGDLIVSGPELAEVGCLHHRNWQPLSITNFSRWAGYHHHTIGFGDPILRVLGVDDFMSDQISED